MPSWLKIPTVKRHSLTLEDHGLTSVNASCQYHTDFVWRHIPAQETKFNKHQLN